jgi:hypothetical protein
VYDRVYHTFFAPSIGHSVRQNKTIADLREERKAKTGGKKMSTDFEEAVIAFAQSLDARGAHARGDSPKRAASSGTH